MSSGLIQCSGLTIDSELRLTAAEKLLDLIAIGLVQLRLIIGRRRGRLPRARLPHRAVEDWRPRVATAMERLGWEARDNGKYGDGAATRREESEKTGAINEWKERKGKNGKGSGCNSDHNRD